MKDKDIIDKQRSILNDMIKIHQNYILKVGALILSTATIITAIIYATI